MAQAAGPLILFTPQFRQPYGGLRPGRWNSPTRPSSLASIPLYPPAHMLTSLLLSRASALTKVSALALIAALALPVQAQDAARGGVNANTLLIAQYFETSGFTNAFGTWTPSDNPAGAGEGWRSANGIGTTGAQTNLARFRAFGSTGSNVPGTSYLLTSPQFSVPQVSSIALDFDVAYAQLDDGMGGTVSETLVVELSQNNGAFQTVATYTGDDLDTAAPRTTAFQPAGAGDWGHLTVDLSAFAPTTSMGSLWILRFSVVDNDGNNLYLDNIEMTADPAARLLRTNAGWRQLSTPAATTYDDVLGNLWTQGFPGSDAPGAGAANANVLLYDEAAAGAQPNGYAAPSNQTDAWVSGTGAFVYVYSDDDNDGNAEGFPKTIDATGVVPGTPFPFPVSYTDSMTPDADGWNLLGNPFDRTIDWDLLTKSNIDGTVYVWNPIGANPSYRVWNGATGNLLNGLIAPFQGFWAKANAAAPSITADAAAITFGGTFYGRQAALPVLSLRLDGNVAGQDIYAESFIQIDERATAGFDGPFDAYFLTPPAADYVALSTRIEDGTRLMIDARPMGTEALTFDLDTRAVAGYATADASMKLSRPMEEDAWAAIPTDWTLTLLDRATNATVNLREASEYTFSVTSDASTDSRFVLTIAPANVVANEPEGTPSRFELKGAYPNPFHNALTVDYALPEAATVRIAVYDVLGREVAVLTSGDQAAGNHSASLAGQDLANGLYLVRIEADGASARYEQTARILRVE